MVIESHLGRHLVYGHRNECSFGHFYPFFRQFDTGFDLSWPRLTLS